MYVVRSPCVGGGAAAIALPFFVMELAAHIAEFDLRIFQKRRFAPSKNQFAEGFSGFVTIVFDSRACSRVVSADESFARERNERSGMSERV